MDRKVGLKGELKPSHLFEELKESFNIDTPSVVVSVEVSNGVLEVGFDDERDEKVVRAAVSNLIRSWSFIHDTKILLDLNQKWCRKENGKRDVFVALTEQIKVYDRIRINKVLLGLSYVVKLAVFDNNSFKNDLRIFRKSLKDEHLQKALIFFYEEVVQDERPLYGIYKAMEVLCCKVGRDQLASLAGKSHQYVDDLMQTAQVERHSSTKARRKFSDQECMKRARILIQAYANSID
jgi:hypothetical protein